MLNQSAEKLTIQLSLDLHSGRNQGVVSTGGSSAKGVRVPIWCPWGRGLGLGSGGWGGDGFPVQNGGKREGGGESGVGTAKESGKSMRTRCRGSKRMQLCLRKTSKLAKYSILRW